MSRRTRLKEWIRTGCKRRNMSYAIALHDRARLLYPDSDHPVHNLTDDDLLALWFKIRRQPVPSGDDG